MDGKTVQDVVAVPVDNYVVSVHVASWAHILPRVHGGTVEPPVIPCCRNQHIIRTLNSVAIVEVEARMTVYPRVLLFSRVEEMAREFLLETLEEDNIIPTPEAYAKGLGALTQRIARRVQSYGVEIV